MKMKKKKDKIDGVFIYGDVDVTEDLKQEALLRTTMFLNLNLVKKLKAEANKKNIKYQQLIREILFAHFAEELTIEERIKNLEDEVFKNR